MAKSPEDTSKAVDPADARSPKPSQAKSKPAPPLTKAERSARMRADKMVIKRMRKR
jgi:hypothetical protein